MQSGYAFFRIFAEKAVHGRIFQIIAMPSVITTLNGSFRKTGTSAHSMSVRKKTAGPGAKRQDIQGLRAVAALAVVFFHATPLLPGGFLGVDVFFVISGFIISQIVSMEIAERQHFSAISFILRRLRRVLPPMAIVVLATIVIGSLIDTPTHTARTLPITGFAALTGWVNLFFLSEAADYFQSFPTNPLLHLWSLAVEIQFYALLAFTMQLGFGIGFLRRGGKSLVVTIVGAVTVLSFAAALSIKMWGPLLGLTVPGMASFFLFPTRLWEFGIGILAQSASESHQTRWKLGRRLQFFQVLGALLIVFGMQLGSDTRLVPGYQAMAPCVGAALIMMIGENGVVGRLLGSSAMTFLGDRSYSIYLWQGPFIVFASILFSPPFGGALGALVSVLIAVALFRPVEFMFRMTQKGTKQRGGGALSFGFAYGGAVALCLAAGPLFGSVLTRLQAPLPLRATELDKSCMRQRGTLGIAPCVYGKAGSPRVMLLGDSHAGAISQAVVDAALRTGWEAHVATASACAVPEYNEDISYRSSCSGYSADVLKYARAERVRLVILQQFSSFYVHELGIGLARWKEGLKRFVSAMAHSGIEVVIVGDNLGLPIAVGRPLWADRWDLDLRHAISERSEIEEIEASIAEEVPGVHYLRARDYLCQGSKCPVYGKGAWLYTDTDHLSYKGAERLAAPIERELRLAARTKTADR